MTERDKKQKAGENKMFRFILLAVCTAALIACKADIAFANGGAVPIRISDGVASRCINPNKDRVWITLRRLITDRSKSFLSADRTVALIINASVKSFPTTPKPISFPLITEANLRGYSEGQVSVPVEYTIIDGLLLRQDDTMYTGAGMEMTILNKSGRTAWGKALVALGETADKLPIPSNPISQTATYLLDFANAAVTKDIEDQNNDDKARSAAIALNFDPTGGCAGGAATDFERTGTIAILQESGVSGPGYVPISRTNDFCWGAELRPAFILKAARKRAGADCESGEYEDSFRQVTNNYVAYFVNAVESEGVLGGPADNADREAAQRRCRANGIESNLCL